MDICVGDIILADDEDGKNPYYPRIFLVQDIQEQYGKVSYICSIFYLKHTESNTMDAVVTKDVMNYISGVHNSLTVTKITEAELARILLVGA